MNCPNCGAEKSRVLDSILHSDFRARKRECLNCETRYNTYEVDESLLDQRFAEDLQEIPRLFVRVDG